MCNRLLYLPLQHSMKNSDIYPTLLQPCVLWETSIRYILLMWHFSMTVLHFISFPIFLKRTCFAYVPFVTTWQKLLKINTKTDRECVSLPWLLSALLLTKQSTHRCRSRTCWTSTAYLELLIILGQDASQVRMLAIKQHRCQFQLAMLKYLHFMSNSKNPLCYYYMVNCWN